MTKTGQIVQIVSDGGYQGQNGYINTFQMTIQCPDGTFTGQIGSKSGIYPMNSGETINVEVTNTQHGVRFKKFNPQYAQVNQTTAPQAAQPPQRASQRQAQPAGRDYDKENRGKCRFGFIQAVLQAGISPGVIAGDLQMLDEIEDLVEIAITGKVPAPSPHPSITEEEPEDSEIPF